MTDTFAPLTSETVTTDGFTYQIARETDATRYVVSEYLIAGDPAHKHRGGTPALRSFTMFADASGCVGTVQVSDRVVRCEYKRGTFIAEDCPPKRDRTPRWRINIAVAQADMAFEKRFNATVPEGWREQHAALYASDRFTDAELDAVQS